MAARWGTSRDRRALAWAVPASLVACEAPADEGPHRELPGSTAADPSTGPVPADTTAADSTGPAVLDPDHGRPGYPAPDCTTLLFPGPPSDVAATPRPDHDAEVLALSIDPTRVAAPQARYDLISADLAAIRALEPALAEVHVGCVVPNGLAFSFLDAEDVNDALFAGDYHAWDCHHAYFRRRQELRLDELTVAIELDGVFGQAMVDAYASLPGLGDHAPHWFPQGGWPVPAEPGSACTPVAGSITLTATLLPGGTLDPRDYRFEHPDGTSVVYRAGSTGPPQRLR